MVTFGIVPTSPESGYGYIRRGAALDDTRETFLVSLALASVEAPWLSAVQVTADGALDAHTKPG